MSYAKTMTDALPQRATAFAKDAAIVIGASLFISLFAKCEILLASRVPINIQDALILFFAVLLGSRRGACVAFSFLTLGILGFPVLSGGVGGPIYFMAHPAAGYLFGYLLGAYAAGWVVEKMGRTTPATAFLGFIAGSAVIFTCGIAYLSAYTGFSQALWLGLVPFIPGNILKTALAVHFFRPRKTS